MTRDLDLNGAWEFRQAGRGGARIKQWLPATVPGTVHTDLLAAGKIDDPFYRANSLDQTWVEEADWLYRRQFSVSADFLREARAVWLDFEGLDTIAAVRVNGQEVGRADNMFHAWRFDVSPAIKAGRNRVEVEFTSAPKAAAELAARTRIPYRAMFWAPRVWLRKAQYSGGWDWAPRLLTCGIWRPVRLRVVTHAEIRHMHAYTVELSKEQAVLAVEVEVESQTSAAANLRVRMAPVDRDSHQSPAVPAGRARPERSQKTKRGGRSVQAEGGQDAHPPRGGQDANPSVWRRRLAGEGGQDARPPGGEGGPIPAGEASVETVLAHGKQILSTRLTIENPALWWPNGLGPQSLYDLQVSLEIDGQAVDARTERIGLRTVELVCERDGQGESFRFRVNGRDLFCKGANWVPADSFLPRVTEARYRDLLLAAREANMNMLRVWGGGIYEDPTFYRICDELGLMVWQDFMFACGEYPEEPPLLENVRREAEEVVRRLRNHPCLALWCGSSENHWFFDEVWAPVQKRHGEAYYNEILPGVCREYDPHRPYWPGSPYGGPKANDLNFGDQHVWSVWGFWMEPETYRQNPARFASEFGFQSMPAGPTVCEFTASEDRRLFSPVIDHHNRTEDGHARIMKFLTNSLGPPADLDDYVYRSQVRHAEAMKIAVEHWRQRWPDSAGALYWQFNDCWPAVSGSAVDWAGRAKALWFASKRFFAPALVSLCPVSDAPCGLTDLDLWAMWDGPEPLDTRAEVIACTLEGKVLKKRSLHALLAPGSSTRLATLDWRGLRLTRPDREFVFVRLTRNNHDFSRNFHYFAPGKYIDWPDPKLRTRVTTVDGGFRIELSARRLARAVCLSADRWEGRFSDNYFDLFPGETYRVEWRPAGRPPTPKAFTAGLAIRSMSRSGLQLLSRRHGSI